MLAKKEQVKRMGIFVFYDVSGTVDEYVEFLLNSMCGIIQKLIIMVNGTIKPIGYNILKKYSNDIFIRENKGYDAGAYKDAFINVLTYEDYRIWDEIVLFNDTFYGPLYPWKKIFLEMEKKKIDFWGLSRYKGKRNKDEMYIPSHIQAYFLVCRKSLIQTEAFRLFWEKMEYPNTYNETIENFEIRFSTYFSEKGYKNSAFTDNGFGKNVYNKNLYMEYEYELIKEMGFPLIKRKVFYLTRFERIEKVISYIRNHTDYNVNMIYSNLERRYKEGKINILAPFHPIHLEEFYNAHKRIFIYGYGIYGKNLAKYFIYKHWKHNGFLVTKKEVNEENILVYSEVVFTKEDGIILALGKKALAEVYPIVKKELEDIQIFLPEIGETT